MVGGPRCLVIHVKCDPNRLRGYGAVGVENGPFLLLWPVAYTTACTTVQAVIYINDICHVAKMSHFILFADDTNIFVAYHNLNNLILQY